MEQMAVVSSISLIAIMIAIGAILSRWTPLTGDTQRMFISLIFNVAMPCIILSSIFHVEMDDRLFKNMMVVFALSVIINVVGIFLGWFGSSFFIEDRLRRAEIGIVAGLGNTAFIGIPLCAVLLGPEGALYAAIFDAGVDFTIWTVAVMLLQRGKQSGIGTLKAMINLPIIAIVVGLLLSYFQLRPPVLFIDLFDRLAALAAPLAMFYIGFLIMNLKVTNFEKVKKTLWLPLTIKLIILPLIVALMLGFTAMDGTMSQTIIIQAMMPTLTLTSVLFAKYSADAESGALMTAISILLGLVTIPVMIFVVGWV
ncbi:AEC family transporter [Chungangia koreensis]|uniref:AEC family transporter n=1 Tax=Chungangia koreensis TaxID=752657 RepID=A0ABV8X237_9LACT